MLYLCLFDKCCALWNYKWPFLFQEVYSVRRQHRKHCIQTEVLELGLFIAVLGHSHFFSLVSGGILFYLLMCLFIIADPFTSPHPNCFDQLVNTRMKLLIASERRQPPRGQSPSLTSCRQKNAPRTTLSITQITSPPEMQELTLGQGAEMLHLSSRFVCLFFFFFSKTVYHGKYFSGKIKML